MDKKTKTIVVVVLAVVVVGGVYYGVNRWRQQRLVNQYLKGIYGTDAGGLLGKLTGGGSVSNQVAQEIAKEMANQAAQQKVDEAKEAAKTPEDKYNETKEVTPVGAVVSVLNSEIKPSVEKVFGKAKIVMYNSGYMGAEGSFLVSFKVPRVVTAQDLSNLAQELTSSGYKVVSNAAEAGGGTVMMEKEGVYLSFSYEGNESQELGVLYIKQ